MKKFAAPLAAVAATSVSLGAAAQAIASQALTAPHDRFGGWLQMNPDPTVAWIMALGFLGLVILRRTRSGPLN